MMTMLSNWWTTIGGLVVGVGQYLTTQGATMPTTKAGWGQFILGLAIVAWGVVMKDATTGSKPGQ